MKEEEYIKDRLEKQLTWYSKESQYNQKFYKRLRLAEIVAAALIPFLSGSGEIIPYNAWIIGTLGVNIRLTYS